MNEMREEVAGLISRSLGGREGEVDGRVAEVVGHFDDEALTSLEGVFAKGGGVKRWYGSWWRLSLWGGLMVAVVFLCLSGGAHVRSVKHMVGVGGLPSELSTWGGKSEVSLFSDEEKFFLGGDPYELWMSDEMNKEFAAEYVFLEESLYGAFPDDLLEIGKRVDPENPWYLYMQAVSLADGAVNKVKKKGGGDGKKVGKYRAIREYEIVDQAEYEKVLRLLEDADSMGELVQHRFKLLEKRLRLYKDRLKPDFASKVLLISESASQTYDGMKYLKVISIFCTKFYELTERGEKEEVEKWLGIYKRFLEAILEDENALIEMLIVKAGIGGNLAPMKAAAERVGLDEEAERLEVCISKLEGDDVLLDELKASRSLPEQSRMGILGRLLVDNRTSLEGPIFKDDDLAWERNGDHSVLTKWLAMVMSGVLVVMLFVVASYLLFKGRFGRLLGGRVVGVLGVRDSLLLVFSGVLLPIICYYVVNQYSPLGVRRWNILAGEGTSVLYQFGSMVLLVLWGSYVSLRWRLSVSLPRVVRRNGVWEWLAVGSAIVAMLLIGCSGYDLGWMNYVCFGLLVYSFGYLVVRGIKGLIDHKRVLAVAAINNGMLSMLAVFIILMTLLVPFYYADEQRCISGDTLHTLKPEQFCVYEQEYRVSEGMRRNLMGYMDMIR